MPYRILPATTTDHSYKMRIPMRPNYQSSIRAEIDASKYLQTLQARLGFARFKMNQGWGTSTLLDVEQLWKEKQQKMMNDLPKPRFTQRDIIDKRAYIPSPGARSAKAKKTKLVRAYSNPTHSADDMDQMLPAKPTGLHFHHYSHPKESSKRIRYHDGSNQSVSAASSSEGESPKYDLYDRTPMMRSSLDYLSYAIAMTEGEEQQHTSSQPLPDISQLEPNLSEETDEEETRPTKKRYLKPINELEAKEVNSPPSSPTTSAAKAIMMFVHSQPSSKSS